MTFLCDQHFLSGRNARLSYSSNLEIRFTERDEQRMVRVKEGVYMYLREHIRCAFDMRPLSALHIFAYSFFPWWQEEQKIDMKV